MSNKTLDLNKIGYYIYFNSNSSNDLSHIKELLLSMPNIMIDYKKKGVYYKKDFYEIVCKKIFNGLKRNNEFSSHLNTKFITNILRHVDAILLIETLENIDDKMICGFVTLSFFPHINLVHTELVGINIDVDGCRQCVFDFIKKFCDHIHMMHLTFGGIMLQMGD
jgi:hypothetical protein